MIRVELTSAEASLLLTVLQWHIDEGTYCGPREAWYRRSLTIKDKIRDAIVGPVEGGRP